MSTRQANGAAIKAIRELLGIPLTAVATKTGLSVGYLSKIERGIQSPRVDKIRVIAEALGVSVAAISTAYQEEGDAA